MRRDTDYALSFDWMTKSSGVRPEFGEKVLVYISDEDIRLVKFTARGFDFNPADLPYSGLTPDWSHWARVPLPKGYR